MTTAKSSQMLKSFFRHPLAAFKTYVLRRPISSGAKRWTDPSSLHSEWDSRTRQIATQIAPNSAVIEFGAGRLVLAECLPEGCTYQPSDIADRGAGTLICDLNREMPVLPSNYDVAVFSGVLEYLEDLNPILLLLKDHARFVIASYASLEECPDHLTRRLNGWVNHLSRNQFVQSFEHGGFELQSSQGWGEQTIYKFRNSRSVETAGSDSSGNRIISNAI